MCCKVGFKFSNVIYLTDIVRYMVPLSVGSKEEAFSKSICGAMWLNGASKREIVKVTIPEPRISVIWNYI